MKTTDERIWDAMRDMAENICPSCKEYKGMVTCSTCSERYCIFCEDHDTECLGDSTMEVYDHIEAWQIESGNQIQINAIDPIEVKEVIDSGDSIMVKGYSHLTGDNAVYILTADTEVGLWTA